MNQNCIDTVRLLLAIAPAVFASGRFAMKGGTALNLFVQEMPINNQRMPFAPHWTAVKRRRPHSNRGAIARKLPEVFYTPDGRLSHSQGV